MGMGGNAGVNATANFRMICRISRQPRGKSRQAADMCYLALVHTGWSGCGAGSAAGDGDSSCSASKVPSWSIFRVLRRCILPEVVLGIVLSLMAT